MASKTFDQLTDLAAAPSSGDWFALVDTSASSTKKLDAKYLVRDSGGSGAIVTGTFTLTLQQSMQAAGRNVANTFTATQTIDNSAGSGLASDIRGASGSNVQRLRTAAGVDVLTALANGDLIAHGYLYTVGINWTSRTSAADNSWLSVAYGNGLFVAVAQTGTGNRVMSSPDGINWTSRTSAADNDWYGVAYGNGLFVAVANTGTGNRVMSSPDGINWTIRTSAADNNWRGVAYGNGLFVAVAYSGTGNRVMSSPDGINWTIRTSAADNQWYGVAYGNGLFVAVANTGTANRVMSSGKQIENITNIG